MRLDAITRSLQMLARADSRIADITFRHRMSQVALRATALVIVLFGLVMLGVAGYEWLKLLWGPIVAALAIALASFLLALIVTMIAAYIKPGRELELAREMHSSALEALIADGERLGDDLLPLRGLLSGSFDRTLLTLARPLIALLMRFLRRSEGDKTES
jgi:hypothetical protein